MLGQEVKIIEKEQQTKSGEQGKTERQSCGFDTVCCC